MLIRLDLTRLAPPFKQFLCRVAAQSVPHVWSLLHLRAIAPAAPALSAVPGCWGQPGRHAGPSPPAATRVHNGASKDGRNRDDEADDAHVPAYDKTNVGSQDFCFEGVSLLDQSSNARLEQNGGQPT
ncbi:hypothetical protein EMIHUDRAFT_244600 [Emiliania huxleyi CCMP1516]|uniref:Uncharacterized protein n=2 Tax=Emiliania huxleyi TaxID=2903 RepID=A0A0D3J0F9_EMIH1|nr:hypothetical protein EMIHUDRAFT_244600 [Emiliania huxleyi CCMP1516]EOD16994.1 hypothetical protein EMIHUDRAFT_244600 [Emiliania huxleyi CCMP1516]|eukprot:XP_005769423.1 hypothetical protein EMIHUDRAFT_244600 [Emiliania huxleyi CCMP1516]